MQYFCYLRRDPEAEGFNVMLQVLNSNPTDYRMTSIVLTERSEKRLVNPQQ